MDKETFARLEKYAFEQVPCYYCFSGEDGTLFHMYGQTWGTCGCASCRFKRLIVSLKDVPDIEQIEEAALNDSLSQETLIATLRDELTRFIHEE